MNRNLLVIATGLALSMTPAFAEVTKPVSSTKPTSANSAATTAPNPTVTLPPDGAELPTGVATNFAFIAPIVGGILGVGALAAGGGGGTSSTPSTTN